MSEGYTDLNSKLVFEQPIVRGLPIYGWGREQSPSSNYPIVGLFNPAASGKEIVLWRALISASSSGTPIVFGHSSDSFGTNQNDDALLDGSVIQTSVAETRSGTDASFPLSGAGEIIGQVRTNIASVELVCPFAPVIIPENKGFYFHPGNTSTSIGCALIWQERDI